MSKSCRNKSLALECCHSVTSLCDVTLTRVPVLWVIINQFKEWKVKGLIKPVLEQQGVVKMSTYIYVFLGSIFNICISAVASGG